MDQLNWTLVKQLGAGSFGKVCLWNNQSSGRQVATKCLKENNFLNIDEIEKLKERWMQEHLWMQNLNTPYIVGCVEVDAEFLNYLQSNHTWSKLPVIVMEYCNGGDLRTLLMQPQNKNGLSEYEVREIMHSLRYAIEFLHDKCKIEHRDLKPDNVVIHNENGKRFYKLTDFGFARTIPHETMLQSMVGTRNYLAPEVVSSGHYKKTVDYWSLGVIAFELMCGILPFIPHQNLLSILQLTQKKPKNCIAISENLEAPNEYVFHEHIFDENRMSNKFRARMEEWLRIALDLDYRTRGSRPAELQPKAKALATDEVQSESCSMLAIYRELDEILATKVLTVFCLNTFKLYTYEVTARSNLPDLLKAMESDTGIKQMQFYFIFPTGHPLGKVSPTMKPIDLYVEGWQNTSDPMTSPVMLYLYGYQCQFKEPEMNITDVIKKCMNGPRKIPQWLQMSFEHHTHFMLSEEQRRLEMFLTGFKEFALTIEEEILQYDREFNKVQSVLASFNLLDGRAIQFEKHVNCTRDAVGEKVDEYDGFLSDWSAKAKQFQDETEKARVVGTEISKRYRSVLRRAKEEAVDKYHDELIKSDYFELTQFRNFLKSLNNEKINGEERFKVCDNAVDSYCKKRNALFNQGNWKSHCDSIKDIYLEFRKLQQLIANTEQYFKQRVESLNKSTVDFQTGLVNLHRKIFELNENDSKRPRKSSLMYDGSMHTTPKNGFVCQNDTKDLISETLKNMKLLDESCNDSCDIPSTIENSFF